MLLISLVGIVALFTLKYLEVERGNVFVSTVREAADLRTVAFKGFLEWCQAEFKKLGPTSIRLARILLHDLALALARLSRASERQAHKLADLVSHKHRFVQRESTNEFLKQVSEYKNGLSEEGTDLDTKA